MSATTNARLHGAGDGAGERDQVVDRHRQRGVVAEDVVAGRVADEQEVDARLVEDARGELVVAREAGDLDALVASRSGSDACARASVLRMPRRRRTGSSRRWPRSLMPRRSRAALTCRQSGTHGIRGRRPGGRRAATLRGAREGVDGQAARLRSPHDRGARSQVRPALVHRRRRHAEVGGDRPGRGRGRVHRGPRVRRLRDRGADPHLRVRPARAPRPHHVPDPAVARRDRPDRAHVLRHHDARRPAGRRRPAQRAQAHAREGGRSRASRSTRTPRSSSTCSSRRSSATEGPSRSTRPATSTTCPAAPRTTSVAARCACSKTSASRSSSATTRPVPARTRSTCGTPTR